MKHTNITEQINVEKWLNFPNLLTFFRIFLIAPFCYCLVTNGLLDFVTLTLAILIALTDFFDGYFARLNQQETQFGKFLDPFADFFLLLSVMLTLISFMKLPVALLYVYMLRAFLLFIQLRYYHYQLGDKMVFQSRMLGKICFVMIGLYIFMFVLTHELSYVTSLNEVLLSLAYILMLISWLDYVTYYDRQYRLELAK